MTTAYPTIHASLDGWDIVLPDDEGWLQAAADAGIGFYLDPATGQRRAPFSNPANAETALHRITTAHTPPRTA